MNTVTGKVYVANGNISGSVSVIDSSTDIVISTIALSDDYSTVDEPFFVGINPNLNEIYVSVFWSGGDDVYFINGATDSITTIVDHGGSGSSYTYGIGVNTNNNKL